MEATDEESHQRLSFQIDGLNDNGYFQIDSLIGSPSVLDPTGFDYEMNQSLNVLIKVSDNRINSISDNASITVRINEIPEATLYIFSQRITTAWEESTVTWSTQPSVSVLHQVFVEGATEPIQDFPDTNIT